MTRRALAAVAGILTAITLGATAAPAEAVAVPARPQPLPIVVAGPRTLITTTAYSTSITRQRQHVVVLANSAVGVSGASTGPLVTIRGTVPSWALNPGVQRWQLVDAGDRRATAVTVKVLRATRFQRGYILAAGRGAVRVQTEVAHYDHLRNAYVASQASPVIVQWRDARGWWWPAATLTTNRAGVTPAALVPIPSGRRAIRLVRPEGATVTGAIAGPFTVNVP